MLRQGLKDLFLQELTPSEKLFFLKKAREAIDQKGYPADETLFHYCYFLTLKERMRWIKTEGGEGFMRVLLVEGNKEIEDTIKQYEERLEKVKRPVPDPSGYKFLDFFSE
jgi:hypothetical protein